MVLFVDNKHRLNEKGAKTVESVSKNIEVIEGGVEKLSRRAKMTTVLHSVEQ
jgi:hypothetical protein